MSLLAAMAPQCATCRPQANRQQGAIKRLPVFGLIAEPFNHDCFLRLPLRKFRVHSLVQQGRDVWSAVLQAGQARRDLGR